MDITFAPLGEMAPATSPPDIVWDGTLGDFALDPAGGLVAGDPVGGAILMLLFSDVRAEGDGDPRGWPGDGFAVRTGEAALGSKLWRYRRSVVTETVLRELAFEAERALQPLVAQGLVDRVSATARSDPSTETVTLTVSLVSDDAEVFRATFDRLWERADGL